MGRLIASALLCAVSASATRAASAQTTSTSVRVTGTVIIAGVVRDSAGRPLSDVSLQIDGVGAKVVSGRDGKYQLRQVPPGDLRVIARRLGYLPDAADVTLKAGDSLTIDFDLAAAAQMLPLTVITDHSPVPLKYRYTTRFDAFFARRATAPNGRFFDRDDLNRLGGPAHALYTIAGVKGLEYMGNLSVIFSRCPKSAGPVLILDGILTSFSALRSIPMSSIELMEVYRGVSEMPIEARGDGCGALVVYTR